MLKTGKKPSELIDYLYSKVGPHHFKRIDVELAEGERKKITKRLKDTPPQSINGVKVVKINATDGFHFTLADNSWLLIRFSGTEPLLRIYSESDCLSSVEKLLESGKKLAGV